MEAVHVVEEALNFRCTRAGCYDGFTRDHDRVRHERQVHDGEKLFICGDEQDVSDGCKCGRAFTRKYSLKRHRQAARDNGTYPPDQLETHESWSLQGPTVFEPLLVGVGALLGSETMQVFGPTMFDEDVEMGMSIQASDDYPWCQESPCHLARYSAQEVIDHRQMKFDGSDLLFICDHDKCGIARMDWPSMVHHQLECHTEAFQEKTGLTMSEVECLGLARFDHETTFTVVAASPCGVPYPEDIMNEDVVKKITLRLEDILERLMVDGFDVDLNTLYIKLVSKARKIRCTSRADLVNQAGAIFADMLDQAREEDMQPRAEREALLITSLRQYLSRESDRKPELHCQLDYNTIWSALDEVESRVEKDQAMELFIKHIMIDHRDQKYQQSYPQNHSTLKWIENTLHGMLSAKEFLQSVSSGETEHTSEWIGPQSIPVC